MEESMRKEKLIGKMRERNTRSRKGKKKMEEERVEGRKLGMMGGKKKIRERGRQSR